MATEASRAPSVREQTTAPRIPAHSTSMAATFAAAAASGSSHDMLAAAIERVTEYEINDCRPFGSAPVDLARVVLEQVHALTVVLGNSFDDQHDAGEAGQSCRAIHVAGCFGAIRSLVALAAMAIEGGVS